MVRARSATWGDRASSSSEPESMEIGSDVARTVRRVPSGSVTSALWPRLGRSSTRRTVRATSFPISIDSGSLDELARSPQVAERARTIRAELSDPRQVLLGVDRLDYTKGIAHRLKAYGELLAERRIDPADTVLIQVATPSRERVEQYRLLRDEIELAVGRINGDFSSFGRAATYSLA